MADPIYNSELMPNMYYFCSVERHLATTPMRSFISVFLKLRSIILMAQPKLQLVSEVKVTPELSENTVRFLWEEPNQV